MGNPHIESTLQGSRTDGFDLFVHCEPSQAAFESECARAGGAVIEFLRSSTCALAISVPALIGPGLSTAMPYGPTASYGAPRSPVGSRQIESRVTSASQPADSLSQDDVIPAGILREIVSAATRVIGRDIGYAIERTADPDEDREYFSVVFATGLVGADVREAFEDAVYDRLPDGLEKQLLIRGIVISQSDVV
ncbi:MAG: hypothetical protein EVA65_12755 [Oceanococcus sp.]|nr:MAG: hypothetical protein EVA65_12755 [Oceanococcus sp.]